MDIISYMNTSIREEPFASFNLEFFPCDVNKLQKVLWYWKQNICIYGPDCIISSLQ